MSKPQQNKVQAEIMQAYRDVFLHTPQGEIIFKDMLKVSGLYQMSGFRDNAELQHMEGGRDMVRRIITILALDENQITKLAIGETINAE
tara:strand:+ start:1159 stop:1425 length:267 start_codon:yes stop_codon:yes gene_type:complete